MEELFTTSQISSILKVSKITVYRYIKSRKITAIKVGRDFRIKKSDFEAFLERNKNNNVL